ncbi:unnamed protein product [Prorocentrum cordatum]|uniref:Solute carrier family 40 protein n=1 Tax=Prorocentrum cordatum TaxID=2364126 RepID=A0ABN9V8N6_9DINO|nr:unnamed protein product [Polarella glacialis]
MGQVRGGGSLEAVGASLEIWAAPRARGASSSTRGVGLRWCCADARCGGCTPGRPGRAWWLALGGPRGEDTASLKPASARGASARQRPARAPGPRRAERPRAQGLTPRPPPRASPIGAFRLLVSARRPLYVHPAGRAGLGGLRSERAPPRGEGRASLKPASACGASARQRRQRARATSPSTAARAGGRSPPPRSALPLSLSRGLTLPPSGPLRLILFACSFAVAGLQMYAWQAGLGLVACAQRLLGEDRASLKPASACGASARQRPARAPGPRRAERPLSASPSRTPASHLGPPFFLRLPRGRTRRPRPEHSAAAEKLPGEGATSRSRLPSSSRGWGPRRGMGLARLETLDSALPGRSPRDHPERTPAWSKRTDCPWRA